MNMTRTIRSLAQVPRVRPSRSTSEFSARRGVFMAVLCAGMVLSQTGCEAPRYYGQAIRGHCRILFQQNPIDEILESSKASPEIKSRLRQVLELRQFAEDDMGLEAGKHYLQYAELRSPYVVWNVFAAPEFSLDAKRWWYPVVGRLSYRGYFNEAMARHCEEDLRDQGMDVFVGGVDAYSTLGWFKDPVLDTFLDRDELSLADLIFHELAHQKLFLKGDTDFNEAFATAVAREGVRRWLRAQGKEKDAADYEILVARQDAFLGLIMRTRKRLEGMYREVGGEDLRDISERRREEMRRRKAELFAELEANYETLKASWNGGVHFDRWFDWPVNNARLNAESTYHQWVPAFENLLTGVNRDLPEFFKQVQALGKLPEEQRQATLAGWIQRPPSRAWTRNVSFPDLSRGAYAPSQ